ncbi:hypothetical protein EV702DRAFT_1193443 [Suillus placidus]|uniref:DUF6533 domain-containing protein n=1 Tax=Suillus placidus TaxID=48579 RepID=A0A9P7A2J3_9AGAM|nr:hypothetical protein EV702DRAFT_1193443 [Suillus placidus]
MSDSDSFGLQLAKYTNGKVRLMTTFIVIHEPALLAAALTVLIYDYFITLHSEVQWTCGRKWGIVRTTFTVSRYVPFAGAVMTLYSAVKIWGTQNCLPFNDAVNGWSRQFSLHGFAMTFAGMHFLGIIASEGLLIARIYGFSGNNNICLIVLLSFSSVILAMAVILSAAPMNLNIPRVSPPCVFEGARSSALPYGLLLFFEIVLMSTTAFLRYRHYFGSHSPLMRSIYRDGLLYMFCIMMVSAANVIVIAVLPLSFSDMLDTPQIVMHSVLASRILFSLPVNKVPAFPTYQSTPPTEMLSCPHELDAMPGGGETIGGANHNQV